MRSELRYVRSNRPQCWFLPVTQVCPTVMPTRAPHQPELAPVLHSEDLRAQVEGPSEGRVLRRTCDDCSCLSGVHTLCGACRRRSPPRRPSDIRCHRRVVVVGGYPRHSTDRSRPSFRRRPAKNAAFQKIRMPSTVTTREGAFLKGFLFGHTSGGLLPYERAPSRRLSRSRRPHFVPRVGTLFLIRHCKVTVRSPAGP